MFSWAFALEFVGWVRSLVGSQGDGDGGGDGVLSGFFGTPQSIPKRVDRC